MPEQRRELRITFPTTQAFAQEWENNISKDGIFLETNVTLESREPVTIVIVIGDSNKTLKLPGEVVHIAPQGVGVQLEHIAGDIKAKIEEIIAPGTSPGEDAASPPGAAKKTAWKRIEGLNRHEKAKLAREGDAEERAVLLRDHDVYIIMNVLKNPRITIPEVIQLSKSQILTYELIKLMTRQSDWMASEEIRFNLVLNPKTPEPIAKDLMKRLSKSNIRKIAKLPIKQGLKRVAVRMTQSDLG